MKEHSQLKTLILCADDYAQSEPITEGILQLVAKKHLSAVSCMADSPHWSKHGPLLQPYRETIDIGIHLNLSDGKPLTGGVTLQKKGRYLSFPELICKSMLGQVAKKEIQIEIDAQLSAFKKVMGYWPDFIDGHRHIHLIPVVQQSILELYRDYFPEKSTYLRIPSNGFIASLYSSTSFPKASMIHLLGAKQLRLALRKSGIPFNASFSGIYRFRYHQHFANYFQTFLKHSKSNGIIMCHPGLEINGSPELLDQARAHEYRFLMNDGFIKSLENQGWKLAKFDLKHQ